MEKRRKDKREEVTKLLTLQKIRDVKELESYKLSVCHPHSAGIDLGSKEIYVALDPRIAAEMSLPIVHVFNTFTSGLLSCRDLLCSCGITTVAMESTSVYWTTIYSILKSSGLEVCLVNPKKFRMVPGRKTDVLDCQWLQTLHLYGLITGSFHPEEKIAELRSYMRERGRIIKDRGRYVCRMQKALTKMNLLLHNVLDDIMGKTGMAIVRAILDGERDPHKLASLRSGRCKYTEDEIAESLNGYYKKDQLFLLKTNYDAFSFFDNKLTEIDSQITNLLEEFPLKKEKVEETEEKKPKYRKKNKNDIIITNNDKLRYIDAMTSLKNRTYLNSKIKEWDENVIYPQGFVVVDLNNIKYINDNKGHEEGDTVIKKAASILIVNQDANTDIIRTDGTEFLIYMVGYSEKDVVAYTRKIYKELKELPYGFGATIGYSMIMDDVKTVDDAINEATIDMRNKKENH